MTLTEMSGWPNVTPWDSAFSSLALSHGRMLYIPVHGLLHKWPACVQSMLDFTYKGILFCVGNYDNGCRKGDMEGALIQFVIVSVHVSRTFSGISTIVCYL